MFKINRKIEYALIALRHMKHKNEKQLTSAKEICEVHHIPFDPTSRVLQIMTQQGILHAEQGAKGGYHIKRDLSEITMKDLSELIAGPIEIANCFHHNGHELCEITHSCQIISPMLQLNEHINELFSKLSVQQLLEARHQQEQNIRSKDKKPNKSNRIKAELI